MHFSNQDPGEDQLISLLLKRQSELNSLLEITRAVNQNSPTRVLIKMMEAILQTHLNVGRLRLMISESESYNCVSKYGGRVEPLPALLRAGNRLKKLRQPSPLTGAADPLLGGYNYYIPFRSKNKLQAYALIGDFNPAEEMLENDLEFIQTLVNAIILALQNKKLLRQRLENERLQREMELATEMQHMLIPVKIYKDEAVDICAKYLPHQDVGGDYFDFIRLNEHELLWCIADVSGKGMPAALLMANLQASLHAWAAVEDDLTAIIQRLNSIVIKNTRGEKFITLFLAKYNQRSRKLYYINAGHNPPVLYSNGTAGLLRSGTTMIGAFEQLPFINEGELTLPAGAMIINYTDGLMDFDADESAVWNEDELLAFVNANGGQSPDNFNTRLLSHLQQVVKSKPIDDITLLTIRMV